MVFQEFNCICCQLALPLCSILSISLVLFSSSAENFFLTIAARVFWYIASTLQIKVFFITICLILYLILQVLRLIELIENGVGILQRAGSYSVDKKPNGSVSSASLISLWETIYGDHPNHFESAGPFKEFLKSRIEEISNVEIAASVSNIKDYTNLMGILSENLRSAVIGMDYRRFNGSQWAWIKQKRSVREFPTVLQRWKVGCVPTIFLPYNNYLTVI